MAIQTDPINEEKAKVLYDEGSKHFDLGPYEEYLEKMKSPEKRKLLYDNLSSKFDIGTYDEYESKLKKKDLGTPASSPSGDSSGKDDARTAAKKYDILKHTTLGSPYYSYLDASRKADKEKAEEKKKNLIGFYDKGAAVIDEPDGYLNAYKNWATENGALDRISYLEDKARSEVEDARRGLSNVSQFVNKLQEDKRIALEKGDTEEVYRLNDLIQAGVKNLRDNKDVAEAGLKTETGLQLHEEAIGFAAEMLNAKMEDLLTPETEKKLTTLDSLHKELQKTRPEEGDQAGIDRYNNLVQKYNEMLQDPDVAQVKAVSEQGQKLVQSEKDLAKKFPNQFQKRIAKKAKQEAIDGMFAGGNNTKLGMMTQLGRSATGFLADVAKIWTVADHDNKYGAADKWADLVDSSVEYINDSVFPIPSDYNKPMMYQDDTGNTIFRSDLILPKTAKVAGDMAGLLFGAGKLSALGKAAGLSSKVSNGIGLFSSSYLQSHDDYKKAGVAAGLSPSNAAWFASASASLTSALEMISPQKYLWSADDLAKSVARNIASGMSRKDALKQSMKFIGEQIGTENLQELTQQMGDVLMESGVNTLTGNNHFDHNSQDLFNEAVETMVVTSLVAGLPAGASTSLDQLNRNKNYRDAIRLAAENKEKYLPVLQTSFRQMGADPAAIRKVFDDINAVKVPKEGTPLYLIHGETVDRAAIEDKLKKGDLSGVYVANDNALEGQLKEVANGGKFKRTPKVKVERKDEKGADGKVKKEDPADYAKRVAQAQIDELVKTGDLKYDGKRVTVLTDHGEQQLALIVEEMNRASFPKVQQKEKTAKFNAKLEAIIEKQNKGKALTLEEAEMLESIEDEAPKLKENKTGQTQAFFTAVVEGTDEKFKPKAPWSPLMNYDEGQGTFKEQYDKFTGNFDQHIATSIPGFRDVQIKKGSAITNMLPKGGLMYDIGGSEGGFVKTITQATKGKVKTINLDVNESMQKAHESSPVEGSEFVNEAFLEAYEEDGKVYPRHKPKQKADVVHESMVFQFISPERKQFIEEIKNNYLKPDGVVILEEKVVPESEQEWMANEEAKDTKFKSKYYSNTELAQKKEQVLTGMKQNQTADADLQAELLNNFDHVYQYWDSGNFKGYIASNDKKKIDAFVKGLGDTKTEFSTRESGYLKKGKVGSHGGVDIMQTTDAKEFQKAMVDAIKSRPQDGAQLELKDEATIQQILDEGGTLYLSEDKMFGGFVSPTGYMGGLFKNAKSKVKSVAKAMQDLRVKKGGRFFDAYGTRLEDIYIKNGFRPVARLKFNEEMAPKGWEKTDLKGKPDVVFFAYDPNGKYKKGDGKFFEDWDEAYNFTVDFAKQNEKSITGQTGAPQGAGQEAVVDSQDVSQEGQAEEKVTPEAEIIRTIMEKAKKALSKIRPDLEVVYYNGEEQGRESLKGAGSRAKLPKGAYGFYAHAQGVIGIDMSKADATTAFHESFHPVIDALKESNPELFKKLSKQAAEQKIELQDGTQTTYLDYMGGNKEEALVEFLADFADGKFDQINEPSVWKTVKNIISQILEALGLKSKDFNIDLDEINDVKELADQLATAISKGKTINLETKAKAIKRRKGVSGQVPGAKKKKLNRTAQRIAYDTLTQYKQIRTDVIDNPQNHMYTPQELKKKIHELNNMTLEEVVVETQNSDKLMESLQQGNQFAVLSAIELLKRRNAAGEDTRPIFKKLRELGTSVGQLLRQFGELKTRSAEGIVNTVLGNLESLGLTPTEEQTKELTGLAETHIKKLGELDQKRVEFIDNANDQNEKALHKAEDEVAKSFYNLNEYTGKITPMGLDSLIPTILQGNLLVVKSIVTNVVGNLIYQPFRQSEMIAGDIVKYAGRKMRGEPVANPFEMYFGSVLHGMIAFGKNIPVAIVDSVRGRGAEYTSALEVRRNLKPLLALQQIFTKAGRQSLPVNMKGNVPISVYIEKALEGTVGWPAEAMFRMLYLGDKPFREAGRAAAAYRMYTQRGGKGTTFKPGGNAEFRKFMANMSSEDMKALEEAAQEETSSNERTLSKIGDGFVQWVGRNIDTIADKTPNAGFKHAVKVLLKILAKANTPFVRVPANLLQYLIELALPIIPFYAGLMYTYRANVKGAARTKDYGRKAAEMFTRAATGYMLQGAVDMMYDAGLLIASGEDDDEEVRQAKHGVARPNGFNLTAYARWRAGGDPTFREGDNVWEFTKLGYLGMFMAYRAEFNESVEKELKKSRKELDMMTGAIEQLNSVVGAALEMSFLQGTYNMLKAFDKGGFQEYGSELFNTLSAVVLPNNLSVTSRVAGDYILRAKDEEALNGFFEKQKVKLFPTLQAIGLMEGNNIENVYPIIGMFGEPARQTPKGKNPLMYHFFNIANSEKIDDPLYLEVYNLSKKIGEVPISAPTPRVKLGLTTYSMTEQDYTYAQMIAGEYKRILLSNMMNDSAWKGYSDDEKKIAMETVNQGGNELAKDYMMSLIFQGIEAGRIVTDDKMGTYSYVQPNDFDINMAVDFFKENMNQ